MKTIYRIEHKESGIGIYRHQGVNFRDLDSSNYYDRHPAPLDDSKLSLKLWQKGFVLPEDEERYERLDETVKVYSFGFSSKRQLRSWIYDDSVLLHLHNNNFILAVCQCKPSQVIIGNSQAMFIRPEVYEKLSIKEFFNLC